MTLHYRYWCETLVWEGSPSASDLKMKNEDIAMSQCILGSLCDGQFNALPQKELVDIPSHSDLKMTRRIPIHSV